MTTEDILIDKDQLSIWLKERKAVTILDIRPLKEREEWLIPGSIHANVYDKLKANDPTAFDGIELSRTQPVIAVCGGGKLSVTAAERLLDNGYKAFSLEGGMKAWNYAWNTAETTVGDVKIIQIRRSAKGCLSYLIGSKNEAVVIDASLDPQVYLDLANANGWTIKYVTDTHIHADYISRTRDLAKASIATHVLIDKATVEYSYSPIQHGDLLEVGGATLEVMHTPGHTMESTSFRLGNDAVFTGDTLFVDGVGRPDLKADQDEATRKSKLLYASLRTLLSLHPRTAVLPAHLATAVPFDGRLISETIAKLVNKLDMLRMTEDEFVKFTTSRIPPTPPNYQTIATLNKQGSYEGYNPADLEAGANRCAIA
jgi:glyoxylase-like metal-dependent hydrolase (beta-lactamase superfamily II)/rhodanese-related sulfurtransferase